MSEALNLNEIPGYKDAVDRAMVLREATYVDHREDICGVEVLQLTPRMFAALDVAGNPLLKHNRLPDPADMIQFLWALSPRFIAGNGWRARWRRRRMARACRRISYARLLERIDRYMEDQLQDSQGGSGAQAAMPLAGFVATLVHRIATAYGWEEDAIADTPIVRLLQYLKLIDRDNGRKICWNPGDKERGEYLREVNQRTVTA
jgi:hypothetical protein